MRETIRAACAMLLTAGVGHAATQTDQVRVANADGAPPPAATLFRWVDPQGRPHFSDRPPPDAAQTPEEIAVPRFIEPELSAAEDPYSILNQTKRLEEARRERERERAEAQRRAREDELQRRQLEAWRNAPPAQDVAAPQIVYGFPRRYPPPRPNWPYHYRRPGPPSLWEPDHPAYRPPPPRPLPPGARF